jgi:hypothetical protein
MKIAAHIRQARYSTASQEDRPIRDSKMPSVSYRNMAEAGRFRLTVQAFSYRRGVRHSGNAHIWTGSQRGESYTRILPRRIQSSLPDTSRCGRCAIET